jgi:GMP synthase (glutamine-hydrolysing)
MGPVAKFLLLQARNPGDPMAAHEVSCFADALGLPARQITPWSLLQGVPARRDLDQVDYLLVGGSGDYSVLDNHSWLRDFFDFLDNVVVNQRVPTFASCFGFQGLVIAGGGQVVKDPENAEVGTFEITLTDHGIDDPLLGPLSPSFDAQLGHKDRADRMPSGMKHLARSERVEVQALRVGDLPIIATQFHPELNRAANHHRYMAYLDNYGQSAASDADEVLAGLKETPDATALLPRWLVEVTAHRKR